MGFIDDLKQAVGFGGTTEVEPGWSTRLKKASYKSPSGEEIEYEYENVSVNGRNKTSAFEFADADGTYVQHKGTSSRVFPLRMFFSGNNCDLLADIFEAMIRERGVGKLEHPRYGVIDVVPFGRWRRTDNLVNNANQVIFDVTWFKTIGIIYPTTEGDPQSATLAAIEAFDLASAEQFAGQVDIDSASELAAFKDKYDALVKKASNVLRVISEKQQKISNQFDDVVDSINAGIDVLVADPLTLAFQTKILLGAPGRALSLIKDRLEAYKNLAGDIFSGPDAIATPVFDGPGSPGNPGFGPGNDSQSPNAFHLNNLFVTGAVTGQIISVVFNEFENSTDAIEAADEVLDLWDQTTEWQDTNYESIGDTTFSTLGNTDTGEGYQQLQKAVAIITGFLIDVSFTLKQERVYKLDRARTIIDVAAELYQDVGDATLDAIIENNSLTGDEIIELPKGKEIVYYV